jgi:two-component sensor histidine kinase
MEFSLDRIYGRSPRSLTVGFLCAGTALVLAVDAAVAAVGGDAVAWTPVRLAGGWTVVGVSSLFLYGALTYHRRRAEAARRELETSNQQLQVLSRVFRHNVRNDLNVIRGYADLLGERVDDDRSRALLETIRETTDDVVEISEKLRVIEESSPDAPAGRIDLVEAAREAAADVDDPDATVTLEAPEEAWIRADRSVEYPIREVFENAVTHNDASTRRVEARVEENGTSTCLEVSDNGPGIPEDGRARGAARGAGDAALAREQHRALARQVDVRDARRNRRVRGDRRRDHGPAPFRVRDRRGPAGAGSGGSRVGGGFGACREPVDRRRWGPRARGRSGQSSSVIVTAYTAPQLPHST